MRRGIVCVLLVGCLGLFAPPASAASADPVGSPGQLGEVGEVGESVPGHGPPRSEAASE